MMKTFTVGSLMTVMAVSSSAQECDLMCAMIYSLDQEACACVPIKWMECHPQYRLECDQRVYDTNQGRDPDQNPYSHDDWYPGTPETENKKAPCDIFCLAIYSIDPVACACVPIKWMECHPQYRLECDQRTVDIQKGRDPDQNPFR